MWSGLQNIILSQNLLSEIIIRVVLLAAVCTMQLTIKPHMHYITEIELMGDCRRQRKDSYVPVWAIIFLVIFVPLLYILASLLITRNYAEAIQALLAWSLAMSINAVITETLKLMVGRPRPDFFYRCFPNGKVTKGFNCTGDLRDVIEGRKSFPSGHSSFSFCSLGFLSISLCGKLGLLSRRRGEGARVVVCLLPLLVAGAVAMSRCCDNHHHWQDVVAGSLLGFVSSYFCYRQYFHSLDSDLAGIPYAIIHGDVLQTTSQSQCCTRDLNTDVYFMLRLCNKNTMSSNKEYE